MKKKLKKYSFDQIKDDFLGKKGTAKRDQYEFDLRLELLGEMIKVARQERDMTQEELGKIIGVQKAQISKLENSTHNVTIDTILKVFEALDAKVKFKVEMDKEKQLEVV